MSSQPFCITSATREQRLLFTFLRTGSNHPYAYDKDHRTFNSRPPGGKILNLCNNTHQHFDYIFADTWHGKYLLLDQVLSILNKGGFYIIDDMLPQPNWPDGHHEKATNLITDLEKKEDMFLTKQIWSTGIIIAVKK